jgi:hypothetical protein
LFVTKVKKAKQAKLSTSPEPEKKPKMQDPQIEGQPLAWRFSACDRAGPFEWNVQPDAKYREVMEKLHEFETKNWNDIIAGGSHPVEISKLDKPARDRLADTERDDLDELMSFRLTGPNRVWCVQTGHIMRVLWWDEDHQVYPTAKDPADRRKANKRKGK